MNALSERQQLVFRCFRIRLTLYHEAWPRHCPHVDVPSEDEGGKSSPPHQAAISDAFMTATTWVKPRRGVGLDVLLGPSLLRQPHSYKRRPAEDEGLKLLDLHRLAGR